MRAVGSNLITFLFFVTFLSVTSSCSKEKYDVIPDVYVSIYIPLSDPVLSGLAPSTSLTLNSKTPINWGGSSPGYNGNGIIIYYDPYSSPSTSGFSAFDCTCPYCYKFSGLSKVVVSDGSCFAKCPECGTNYAMPSSGTPTSEGPGRYQLKNYHADVFNGTLHIWNR